MSPVKDLTNPFTKSVMTEERMTGGTCVNRGCLPWKNVIKAAKIIHNARHPRYPGLTPAEVNSFAVAVKPNSNILPAGAYAQGGSACFQMYQHG